MARKVGARKGAPTQYFTKQYFTRKHSAQRYFTQRYVAIVDRKILYTTVMYYTQHDIYYMDITFQTLLE